MKNFGGKFLLKPFHENSRKFQDLLPGTDSTIFRYLMTQILILSNFDLQTTFDSKSPYRIIHLISKVEGRLKFVRVIIWALNVLNVFQPVSGYFRFKA